MSKYKIVISRNDNMDFVGVANGIPAKIDTGAFRSAIHASDVKVKKRGDKIVLTCNLLGHRAAPQSHPFETSRFSRVQITNSFGHKEHRYEVAMRVKLGGKVFNTSFTLADRSKNVFPVLVGRKLLKGRFIVDVSTGAVNRQLLNNEFGIKLTDSADELE